MLLVGDVCMPNCRRPLDLIEESGAQTADNPLQFAMKNRALKTAAASGAFPIGMRVWGPVRGPLRGNCHAGGRGFESRRSRYPKPLLIGAFQ
jgi:hypothetical protein